MGDSSRRRFLKLMGGAGGAALLGSSEAPASAAPTESTASDGPFLLKNGHVMTMGPEGDIPGGDVLVRDGNIEAVGDSLDSPPEAEEIDLENHLVLPGFVDTHTHLWLTQIETINEAEVSVSITPISEHRVGFGVTRLDPYSAVDRLSLGVDGNALSGSADFFAVMRLLALTETGAARN